MNRKYLSVSALLLISIFYTSINAQGKFSIMSYNVENFFDTIHDVYKLPSGQLDHKQDYTYLPKALKEGAYKKIIKHECSQMANYFYKRECFNKDWNAEVYKVKLDNILFAIGYKPNHCGADIIFLQEVENKRVLRDIAQNLPKHCGYKYFGLKEGPDKRGIDVGFISRFKLIKDRLIDYPVYPGDKKRRSLYQANFNVDGKVVSVIGNHWPSMGTKDTRVRMRAAKLLSKAFRESKADLTVAVGDFNTSEHKEQAVYTYLKRYVRGPLMMGVIPNMPGSHYYQKTWEFLDRIFVSKKSFDIPNPKIVPIWESFHVVNRGLLWDRSIRGKKCAESSKDKLGRCPFKYVKGTPKRFSEWFKSGYSDHLPITMSFQVL